MLKFTYIFALIGSILLFTCNKKSDEVFSVEIYQNEKKISIKDHVVNLENKPFVIQVELNNHLGIYMGGTTSSEYFDLTEDQQVRDFQYLPYKAFAEKEYNENRQIILDPDGFHFLFYDPDQDWHRFDADLEVNGNKVIAKKTVEKFWYKGDELKEGFIQGDKDDLKVEVKEMVEQVYLFFLATTEDEDGPPKELKRDKIKIVWQ